MEGGGKKKKKRLGKSSARFDKCGFRKKHGIPKIKKIIMFFGTPRSHKGIEDLIDAINLIKNRDVILTVVGINDRDQYFKKLAETTQKVLNKRFKWFGLQPFERVPEFLAMSDVVVILQKKTLQTVGQVPAKVFDAMAMAKPIIATAVSDLPEIVDGCGWIVDPENPEQLAETIQYTLNNPEEAKAIGWKARQKCIDKYSWDVMENVLLRIFSKYER